MGGDPYSFLNCLALVREERPSSPIGRNERAARLLKTADHPMRGSLFLFLLMELLEHDAQAVRSAGIVKCCTDIVYVLLKSQDQV